MYPFETLEVWQLSLDLIERIYHTSETLPEEEKYGLVSQIRRAAVSVSLNIAEGKASDSDMDFRRFLGISVKSVVEIIACMKVCERLQYLDNDTVDEICRFCDKIEAKIRKFRTTLGKERNMLNTKSIKRKASSVKR